MQDGNIINLIYGTEMTLSNRGKNTPVAKVMILQLVM